MGSEQVDPWKRQVQIFFEQMNHMQSTPLVERSGWTIQFERQAVYKTRNMGWVHSNDSRSKRNLKFESLEDAIAHCRSNGLITRCDLCSAVPEVPRVSTQELR